MMFERSARKLLDGIGWYVMFCLLPRCAHPKVGQLRCFPQTAIFNVLFLFAVSSVVTLTDCGGIAGIGSSRHAVSQIRVTIPPATTTAWSGGSVQCAAPTYRCARSDTAVIPMSKLPNWGGLKGAGTIFTDPSFNSAYPPQYVRVTDANTNSSNVGDVFSVGAGSGDDSHFNADDTLLWVNNSGSAIFVFGLMSSTLQVGLVTALNPNTYCCDGQWSQINRNYFYTLDTSGKLWRLDFTGLSISSPGAPTASLVYDFAVNCGVNGIAPLTYTGPGASDTVFDASFGPQDTARKVAAYNASTGKCYLYDTQAGTVTQYPGRTLLGTVTTPDRYQVHNAHGYADGVWMQVVMGGTNCFSGSCATDHAWRIGTTTVNNCVSSCGDHWTETADGWVNSIPKDGDYTNAPGAAALFRVHANFSSSAASNLSYLNSTPSSATSISDYHPTTKNDPTGTHSYPIFTSTAAAESPAGVITHFASNEIIAWQQAGGHPAPILRFGHTFNSGQEPGSQFQAQIAVGAVSPTGHFFAFTTDGEGTLGNKDGVHSTCKISTGTCRSDVFILNLVPPTAN